jgi:hypothetical protein
MRKEPENVRRVSSDTGNVESSERTLDGFESDGNDATDESYNISSRPYSNVEFEGGSHLSNSQSSVFDQAPYMELVPENETVTGVGYIVEGSERTLDKFEKIIRTIKDLNP